MCNRLTNNAANVMYGAIVLMWIVATAGDSQAQPAKAADPSLVIGGGTRRLKFVDGRQVKMSGTSMLALANEQPLVNGSQIQLNSEDAWVWFQQVRPSAVNERYVRDIRVNGEPAKLGENLRIAQYGSGAMVIPHGPGYHALQTFDAPNLRGNSLEYVPLKYYRDAELGEHDNKVASFVLKRGYMATFAANPNGSGASQVFIAHDRDVRVNRLPRNLADEVSFVRVFPWRWTGKKGFGGSLSEAEQLNCQWRYQWDAGGESSLDIEYVPMKHKEHWDSWENINRRTSATHVLGFNEPMQEDQANMSMEKCLELWPRFQESGLRIGSPCPTDGTVDWVVNFIAEADKRGYRVDFVAVHYYKGNWSTKQLVEWLLDIHRRCGGRPIWLTEFNNGAPWVQDNPSRERNAAKIAEFIRALDMCPFVERYAIFNLGENRAVIDNGNLTPAGIAYRDHPPVEAYVAATQ